MFREMAIIEPINVDQGSRDRLKGYAEDVRFYSDVPGDDAEIIRRIGSADAVLLSFTTRIGKQVLDACPNVRYIGMCNSLYSVESANVDIPAARDRGIVVLGVRDYGDEGVREYVIGELARFLHGFDGPMWRAEPTEFTDLPVGILGMGTTGLLLADAFRFFGADVHYYSRTRKPELEAEKGYTFLPLAELLPKVDILCTCLNKNVILLHREEFELFGNGKIIVNTSIGPGHDVPALLEWLDAPGEPGNYIFSDTYPGIDPAGKESAAARHPHAFCVGKSAGLSSLSRQRLGRKVIENIESFLADPSGVLLSSLPN
ncbi:MAG: NAD(P)-dependent oxidoreductase [Oscillospiraceae bacterium]